jgi:hypothetical protein
MIKRILNPYPQFDSEEQALRKTRLSRRTPGITFIHTLLNYSAPTCWIEKRGLSGVRLFFVEIIPFVYGIKLWS